MCCWAHSCPYTSETEREQACTAWLHHYNHHTPHTGIGGQTPSERVDNLTGQYTYIAWADRRMCLTMDAMGSSRHCR